jgi:hypothetical protein
MFSVIAFNQKFNPLVSMEIVKGIFDVYSQSLV